LWLPVDDDCELGEAIDMLDLVFVILTVAFFLGSWAYVRGCERL
jgi:hypothetical protein